MFIFVISSSDEIWYTVSRTNLLQNDKRFPPHLNNVSTLPCELEMLIRRVVTRRNSTM